jgi:Domain of unknown function (DUF4440)
MEMFKQELLELELSFWNAAGNPEIYESNFAADGLAVFAMEDGILPKKKVLASVSGGKPWSEVKIENETLLRLADDVVALVYKGTGIRNNADPYTALISSVYRRKDGGWELALHQQTPLPVSD